MKVLMMVPELNVGGVETHVLSLAEGMARSGFEVTVVSNGGALVSNLDAAGAAHINLPIHRKSPFTIREMAGEVARIITDRDIDIVHAHSRVPAWITHFAIRSAKTSFVVTAHGQYAPHLGSRVMAYGDRIICVSRVIRDHLIQKLGAPPLKTTVVYNGIDLAEVEKALSRAKPPGEMRAELGLPAGAPLVGIIGRLTATKGIRYFIEALSLLSKSNPEICGVVVGDGPQRRELQDHARALGLAGKIAFPGVRTDVTNFLNAFDVYTLSSFSEGFPMGCLEAMSCRVPIVASNVGGVPEMLTDGETALLVEPRNAEALADRIGKLLRDRALCGRITDAGFRTVRARFSKEKMIEEITGVYEDALRGGAKRGHSERKTRTRVLLTLPELNVGGVETHMIDLANGLKKRGYQPLVVSYGGNLVRHLDEAGIDHLRLPVHSKAPPVIFRMAAIMRKIIRRNNIQMIHAHSRVPAWISYIATRGLSLPFITTAHSTYSVHIGSRVMVWSDQMIAVSGYVRDHMIKNFGAPMDKTTTVHNGVAITEIDESIKRRYRDEWNLRDGAAVVGMVASLSPRKGYSHLLRATRAVLDEHPDTLFLAVGGGIQKEELVSLRGQLGIPEDRFRFLGVRSDVRNLLSAMDIFVLSSTSEGLPYVILEAMAMGKPVVSSDVGGIPEAITSGLDGILVKPGDVEQLGGALRELINAPSRRREMGAAARKTVEETFTVERMVDETEAVYRKVLN